MYFFHNSGRFSNALKMQNTWKMSLKKDSCSWQNDQTFGGAINQFTPHFPRRNHATIFWFLTHPVPVICVWSSHKGEADWEEEAAQHCSGGGGRRQEELQGAAQGRREESQATLDREKSMMTKWQKSEQLNFTSYILPWKAKRLKQNLAG